MATMTVNNRFIREVERRGPRAQFGDVAYTGAERSAAKRLGDVNARTALMTNPSGAGVAGGKDWQDFDQYHGYQRQLAAGRGGKHTVGAFSGGGDINQRSLDGSSPTFQVNGGGPMPATRPASYLANAGEPAYLTQARHDTELEELQARGRNARIGSTAALAKLFDTRAAMNRAPGTQGQRDSELWDAGLEEDVNDIKAERGADRFFMPGVADQRRHEFANELQLATAPERIQADSSMRRTLASNQGNLAVAQAKQETDARTVQRFMEGIARASRDGAFGVDESGTPLPPPPALQAQMSAMAMGAMGDETGGMGAAPMVEPPPMPGTRVGQIKRDTASNTRFRWDGRAWLQIPQ